MKADKNKIAFAMAESCITPKQLAELANMPRASVNNVLGGRGVYPATLGKVAKALGVSVEAIISDEWEK